MLARDSTSGCYSDASKSQGSLGAWGSFECSSVACLVHATFPRHAIDSSGPRIRRTRDHQTLRQDASDRTRVLVRGSPNFRRSHLLNSSMSGTSNLAGKEREVQI